MGPIAREAEGARSTATSLGEAMFECSPNERRFLQHDFSSGSSQGGGGGSRDLTYSHLKIKMLLVSSSAQLPGVSVANESQK